MDKLAESLLDLSRRKILYVVVMIGNSGSGKSFLASEIAKSLKIPVINPDQIRSDLGSETDQSNNDRVWQIVHQAFEEQVEKGQSFVFDSTLANEVERQRIVAELFDLGLYIVGIWLDTPIAECLYRNLRRKIPRPEYVLQRMAKQLFTSPPQAQEGFSELWLVQNDFASSIM